jgi:hypothetical protein
LTAKQEGIMAKKKQKRRSATLEVPVPVELARTPITIRGYDLNKRFVCSLTISGAGVLVHAGEKGNRFICNLTWEGFVERLEST